MHLVVIGGSDAGIMAGLRARELDSRCEVTLLVADRYPNYSVCGIPYHIAGDVPDWHDLAHRSLADLRSAGLDLRLGCRATRIEPRAHALAVSGPSGREATMRYDRLVVATGAEPATAGIAGLDGPRALGPAEGVHRLRTMGQMRAIQRDLDTRRPRRAVIVGAGYIGLEMAEALTRLGLDVTVVQRGPEVLPTLDADLGTLVHAELERHAVRVRTGTSVDGVEGSGSGPTVLVHGPANAQRIRTDLVIVAVGVRPSAALLVAAGAKTGPGGAIAVDEHMRTGLPDIYAAGDCATTRHRLLGETWLPLGSTAHKQGRIAGENAAGGDATFAGILGTQVVKVFDRVAARTGLREAEAVKAGLRARSVSAAPDDHKAYYPGAHPLAIRLTGDAASGRLLGGQLVGTYGAEVAKRADVLAAGIFAGLTVRQLSDLDLAYTPPLGAPWDALQAVAQLW